LVPVGFDERGLAVAPEMKRNKVERGKLAANELYKKTLAVLTLARPVRVPLELRTCGREL
jgi:hypothetical protein